MASIVEGPLSFRIPELAARVEYHAAQDRRRDKPVLQFRRSGISAILLSRAFALLNDSGHVIEHLQGSSNRLSLSARCFPWTLFCTAPAFGFHTEPVVRI